MSTCIRPENISGVILNGPKGPAVETEFDPPETWAAKAITIRTGLRGYRVLVCGERHSFESYFVGRARKFWLLLSDAELAALGVAVGDEVTVSVTLIDTPTRPAKARRRSR